MGASREEAQITSSGSRSADRTKKLANMSTHNGTTCDNQVPRPPWSHSRHPYGRTDSRPDAVCLYISLRPNVRFCRGWCAEEAPLGLWDLPAASCTVFGGAPGHPDKGMKSAVGDVLEALNLLETGPLVHGDRPAVERSHREGIALCAERR